MSAKVSSMQHWAKEHAASQTVERWPAADNGQVRDPAHQCSAYMVRPMDAEVPGDEDVEEEVVEEEVTGEVLSESFEDLMMK